MKKESKFLRVPYGMSVHGEEEVEAVVKVLRSSTQMGDHVREMESRVAQLCAKKHGIMVNSGSSANYLAVEIMDLEEGSEVITPALTFSTTVSPLVRNNLIPAFVDVEVGTYNIDADKIEEMIGPKTKAIMIPNLIGNLPNWKKIRALADYYNLLVIEDTADTLGATINNRSSGVYSDISTTSFYGSHVVNCAGNGGMLSLNNEAWNKRAKLLRSWGRSSSLFVESEKIENRFNVKVDGIPYDAKFVFDEPGYNLEPSEMGAAFGLVQLDKLESNIDTRAQNFKEMCYFFRQYENYFILPKQCENSRTGWLAFPLTIKDSAPFTRTEMQIFLEKRGIQTRTVFTGNILRQPGFKSIQHRSSTDGYPKADGVMRGGILLACHQGFTEEMKAHVKTSVNTFLKDF